MSLNTITKVKNDYKVKEDVVPVLSREHNLAVTQVNTNETGIATNVTAIAANLAGTALTATEVGAAATGTTAVEYGDGNFHKTVLTVSTALGAIGGGAALGLGKLIYTLPAGAVIVKSAYVSMALTAADGNIDADTPVVGLGTVIASGVVSDLVGTETFEDISTGKAAADCTGTATVQTVADQILVIERGDAHTVHFNVASTWAASGEIACPIAGTVILEWMFVV
jgi:hypothetical protein